MQYYFDDICSYDKYKIEIQITITYGCALTRATSEIESGPKNKNAISPQCSLGLKTKPHVNTAFYLFFEAESA